MFRLIVALTGVWFSGRSAISPDEQLVAVSNLHDGFDLYRTSDQTHIRTFFADTSINVSLPILFIDNGSALLMGSSCGKVKICDASTGVELQELSHGGKTVCSLVMRRS